MALEESEAMDEGIHHVVVRAMGENAHFARKRAKLIRLFRETDVAIFKERGYRDRALFFRASGRHRCDMQRMSSS
jgi:hypothetical protein